MAGATIRSKRWTLALSGVSKVCVAENPAVWLDPLAAWLKTKGGWFHPRARVAVNPGPRGR